MNQEDLKKKLTPEQFYVTQECGTEPPFQNPYWDNHRAGIYVDVVTGDPLFSSLDKYDSGTGWPSFTKTIQEDVVTSHHDDSMGPFYRPRIEIRGKISKSHLGHVFDDGPRDKGGKRFCMNSAALKFIPVEDLEKEGYGQYLSLFNNK